MIEELKKLTQNEVRDKLKTESIGSEFITAISKRTDLDDINREIVDLKLKIDQLRRDNEGSDNYKWLQDALLSITDWGTDIFEALYKDEDVHIRNALAMNPSLPESILLELSNDSDIRVILSVISNPSCSINILKITSEDKESIFGNWIRESVALNINTPKNIIKILLKDDCRWVREAASSHESIEKSTITKLIKNGDRYVLKGLLTNPNSSVNIKSQIEEMLKDEETYPIHYIDLAQNDSYKNVDNFHTDRFFSECLKNGHRINDSYDYGGYDIDEVEGQDEEWFIENGFSPYGEMTFLHSNENYENGIKKFFQISIYLPNYEGSAINMNGLNEVLNTFNYGNYCDIEELLESHSWLLDYQDLSNLLDKIEKNNIPISPVWT